MALVSGLAGCGGAPSGRPPSVRIQVSPAYVPLGDQGRTEVTLDGSDSLDAFDDPARAARLNYQWEIDEPDAPLLPDARAPIVTTRIAAERPVTVRLTVIDVDGQRASAAARIGVSLPP